MGNVIALLFAFVLSTATPQPIKVDAVEINHYHDAKGEYVFSQLILRRWLRLAAGSGHRVEDWRLIKSDRHLTITSKHGRKQIMFTEDGILRVLEVSRIRETWTQIDPELVDREIYPQDQRRSYLTTPTAN
jgi:hypothetical protein